MQRTRGLTITLRVAACTAAVASSGYAQGPRSMTLVDLLEVPTLSDPQLSPDGRQVLYILGRADWKANKRFTHVWRANIDGTAPIQLTSGDEGESSPRWSPDGKQIAFMAKRGSADETQVYLIDNAGGEALQLTSHPTSVSSIAWSPDGSLIYFLASDEKTTEEQERDKAKDDVFAFDENYQQQHLWSIAIADKVERRVTQGAYSVTDYRSSRDGRKIVFHRAPTSLTDAADETDIWIMNANGSGAIQLTRNTLLEDNAELSPDNSQVIYTSSTSHETMLHNKVFLVPAAGGASQQVLPTDLPYDIDQASWSKDGRAVVFLANLGVRSELFTFDLATKRLQQLTDGRHSIGAWTLALPSGQHVFTINEPINPGDVWLLPADGDASPRRVTHVFDYLARQFRLPRQEKIEWKGADGVTVEGLLFYPLDYQAGRAYPLAVQTHGGPQGSDKFGFGNWSSYVQVLTAKGYAVLKPNYRGSTGYGDAFIRDMAGHYFKNSHLDVMAGVDHLIRLGIADPDRLVKMGWSAGGHMTNKIITFTDRFKAASSGAGAANWISMYAQSDIRWPRTHWFGGTPWQKNAPIDVYWENSPLKYVANVKTPTLILVGQNDPRVPPPQSVELYRALKSNGVPTHLYMAPRAGHGWSELRHQLFKMNVELAWFEKYAMGRNYVWEKAPGEVAGVQTGLSREP